MEEYPFLLWFFLTVAFVIILALHILENNKIKDSLQKKYEMLAVKQIIRFHWSRSIQLISIMGFSFILIALYDYRVRELANRIDGLEGKSSPITRDIASKDEENLEIQKNYYPPLIADNQSNINTADSAGKNNIEDIFDIRKTPDNKVTNIDDIKTRYEDLLVTYLLMQKCGKATVADYNIIMAAMQKEIAALQAPVRLQYDTLTAAKGSYEELYSNNDCEKSTLVDTETQYRAYINALTSPAPATAPAVATPN